MARDIKLGAIGGVPNNLDQNLRSLLQSMKEHIEYTDESYLTEAQIIDLINQYAAPADGGTTPVTPVEETIEIDPPTSFTASKGQVWANVLEWTDPVDENFRAIEIVCSTTNDRTEAVQIAVLTATLIDGVYNTAQYFKHDLGGSTTDPVYCMYYPHYYWIRARGADPSSVSEWVPSSSTAGEYVSSEDTIGETIDKVMEILMGGYPDDWVNTTTYSIGDMVAYTTTGVSRRYRCIKEPCLNKVPTNTTPPLYWEPLSFLIDGVVDDVATVGLNGNLVIDGTILANAIAARQIRGDHILSTTDITLLSGGSLTIGSNGTLTLEEGSTFIMKGGITTNVTGNLLNNFSITENLTGWDGTTGFTIVPIVKEGVSVKALRVRTNGNVQIISHKVQVDPSQMYRVSLSIRGDETDGSIGTRYFGMYAFDKNGNYLECTEFYPNGRTSGGYDDNCYFWYGDIPGGGNWRDMIAYIIPWNCPFGQIPNGKNADRLYVMPPNTTHVQIRFLNYYNAGTYITNHFFSPTMVPVEGGDVTAENTALDISYMPSVTGGKGFYCTSDYLGFYNPVDYTDTLINGWSQRWRVAVTKDGLFRFAGNANNKIEWNGSDLLLKATVYEVGEKGFSFYGKSAASGRFGGALLGNFGKNISAFPKVGTYTPPPSNDFPFLLSTYLDHYSKISGTLFWWYYISGLKYFELYPPFLFGRCNYFDTNISIVLYNVSTGVATSLLYKYPGPDYTTAWGYGKELVVANDYVLMIAVNSGVGSLCVGNQISIGR